MTAPPSNQQAKLDQEIMESIGWNENAFAPIASDDNKLLMHAIRLLQEDKLQKGSHVEQLGGRVVWLKQHVENNHDDIQRNLVRISEMACGFLLLLFIVAGGSNKFTDQPTKHYMNRFIYRITFYSIFIYHQNCLYLKMVAFCSHFHFYPIF